MPPEKPTLKLLAPAPVIFGVPFVAGIALHFIFDSARLGLPLPIALALGGLFVFVSVALAGWAVLVMRRAGENPDPRHPTQVLVDAGPFKFSRNPIYLAMVLGGVGVGLGADSILVLVSVLLGAVAVDRMVIEREEQYLQEILSEDFSRYSKRVRRWI